MSIKTEIDRIKQSKVDIISALETKGVTVPSDASIDDLSALVEAIEVGGTEDLSSELSTQSTLITTQETTIDNIISALEGKASGGSGGSVETCDVTINANYYNGVLGIGYTTVENGVVSTSYSGRMTSSSTTISNVLRGSAISILYNVQYSYDISTENATYITELGTEMFMYTLSSVHLFKAPTTSQTGVITITDED